MEINAYEILAFSSVANRATMRIFDMMFITFNVHRKSAYVIVIYPPSKKKNKIIIVTYCVCRT